MENIYLIFVVVLFALAISNLVVGVSNDAVNFLVSALGSRSAPFWVIMIVSSFGILAGALSSDGMMEVARKGIFNPEMYVFSEIILIFLAVMITNIILLDLFNTFGFPTSTTVSLVFELLGAAVGIATIKIINDGGLVADYINSSQAITIIGGILLSVVFAFSAGALIQYIIRFIFSFNTKKTYKYFGALWGGLALAIITFFLFSKGFKHSFAKDWGIVQWAIEQPIIFVFYCFVVWTIVFQILIFFTKINILRIVVLAGTFALAMAFAGNDLVNFIGVPLAGFSSWDFWSNSGIAANEFKMDALSEKVNISSIFLIAAGGIMVGTLWLSKKARNVTETSINLSRQSEGYERFGSSPVARSVVRAFVNTLNVFGAIVPKSIVQKAEKRFDKPKLTRKEAKEAPAFDLLRASVNLVVASIIITIATSYKLPLSTTYVTFMVAMGTSLSDRAWGRDSAVYRVTGVISVIGGWFITAFVAFTAAFIIVAILYFGGMIAVISLVALAVFVFLKTKIIHKKREDKKEEFKDIEDEITNNNVFEKCTESLTTELNILPQILDYSLKGLKNEDRKSAKKAKKLSEEFREKSKKMKYDVYKIIQILQQNFIHSAQYYIREIDYLRETSNAADFIALRIYEHIDNNHEGLSEKQIEELELIKNLVKEYIITINGIIKNNKYNDNYYTQKDEKKVLLTKIEEIKTIQLRRVKTGEVSTMNSVLYLNILAEYKNLVLFFIRIMKSQKKFIRSKEKWKTI